LYTHETDEAPITVALEAPDNSPDRDHGSGFVISGGRDLYAIAEHAPLTRTLRKTVEDGKRIRWHETAPPLDYIAVVVVVGGLNQFNQKGSRESASHSFLDHITAMQPSADGDARPFLRLKRIRLARPLVGTSA
jgi:hypothetical protein